MTTVMIYESHPAVLAGLQRRLEAETGITVAGVFGDPHDFTRAVQRARPDAAIVGAFGPGAIQAANDVHRTSHRTKLLGAHSEE